MNRTAPRQQHPNHRSGFSLLELLAAIVIIAILISLLFPAINAVRRRAQITQVSAEMTQFEQAIASFKALYGVEPPSSLLIPPLNGTWTASSQSKVRGIWPQFEFRTAPPSGSMPGDPNYYWNGGLNNTVEIHLSGAECLAFFLGGRSTGAIRQAAMSGFSKNPETPWTDVGQNRDGPFFGFDSGRLVDVDTDQFLEYVDPLPNQQTPYLFLSSQGKNYHATNSIVAPITPETVLFVQDDFDVHGGFDNSKDLRQIYTKSGNQPHRPNGYQIISPGLDGQYGTGGNYVSPGDVDARKPEQDNITNFAGGALQ